MARPVADPFLSGVSRIGVRKWKAQSAAHIRSSVRVLRVEGQNGSKHTVFGLAIDDEGEQWTLEVRYSVCREFYERLLDSNDEDRLPKFPGKAMFWENQTSPDFLEARRAGLEHFFSRLFADPALFCQPAVLRFVDPLLAGVAVTRTADHSLQPLQSPSREPPRVAEPLGISPPPAYQTVQPSLAVVPGYVVPSFPSSSPSSSSSSSSSSLLPGGSLLDPWDTDDGSRPLLLAAAPLVQQLPPVASEEPLIGPHGERLEMIPTEVHQLPLAPAGTDIPQVLLLADGSECWLGTLLDSLRDSVAGVWNYKRSLASSNEVAVQLAMIDSTRGSLQQLVHSLQPEKDCLQSIAQQRHVLASYAGLESYLLRCLKVVAEALLWAQRIENYLVSLLSRNIELIQPPPPAVHQPAPPVHVVRSSSSAVVSRHQQERKERLDSLAQQVDQAVSRALLISAGQQIEDSSSSSSAAASSSTSNPLEDVAKELRRIEKRLDAEQEHGGSDARLDEMRTQLENTRRIMSDPEEKCRRLEARFFQLLSDASAMSPGDADVAHSIRQRADKLAEHLSELRHIVQKSKSGRDNLLNRVEDLQENLVDLEHRFLRGFDRDKSIAADAADVLVRKRVEEARAQHIELEDEMFQL